MALAFNTTKIEPSTEGFDKLALLEATENLNQAWMDLTEAQRGMDEVCAIMENIHTSVDLINKFGKDAIPMLNVDGGLEALLQIPENVITAEKAMEGFGEAAKNAWEKFKDFVVKIFEHIKHYLKRKFDIRFDYLRRVKALKSDIESKGSQSWSVDNKVSQTYGYLIKHSDYMDLLGKCDKIVEIVQPVIEKVIEESEKVETIVVSDKYVAWNNSMIKLVGDSIRSLSVPLASVGTFLKVSDDGIVHCYQKHTIKGILNIFTGKSDVDEEYVSEDDNFHPISPVDKESTLALAGWTYENAIKAADKLIEHYDRFGHFDTLFTRKTEDINNKFLAALNKISQNDTERIKVLKGTFNSVMSFYRICLMLQDYGFYHILAWARDVAYAR